ncbi:hypothetical protein VNO80_19732 [Phaseolus coccineus]|uniref:Uncharacterized protein n=1 Tax=Phaseolus coccineus TaxID=3886 RepID=A0AAN9R541_PHACN
MKLSSVLDRDGGASTRLLSFLLCSNPPPGRLRSASPVIRENLRSAAIRAVRTSSHIRELSVSDCASSRVWFRFVTRGLSFSVIQRL